MASDPPIEERMTRILEMLRPFDVTSIPTVQAFRLDAVDDALVQDLALGPRRSPRSGHGLMLPTFVPKSPDQIIGLIRIRPSQGRHGFLGQPRGIAGPLGIATARRVMLVDAPMLAMRLHQAGVEDVAIVEHPDVLAPLVPWIARRQVVLVAHRYAGIEAMRNVLPLHLQKQVTTAMLPSFEGMAPPDLLQRLGVATLGLRYREYRKRGRRPWPYVDRPPITGLTDEEIVDFDE